MIEARPDTTVKDVRATNERAGWIAEGAGDRASGAFRLGPAELRAAWEMSSNMLEWEYL